MSAKFTLPSEEIWVKEVMLDTPEKVNEFLRSAATDKTIRGVNILTCNEYGRVLITFERNVNVDPS